MKTIELKKGETARIIGGKIIIEEAFEPKEGDFIVIDTPIIGSLCLCFKEKDGSKFCHFFGTSLLNDLRLNGRFGFNHGDTVRPATESEKQALLDAIDKEGLRWNAEEKRVEEIKPEVVEMTMEQVCEKLGMNVKIVKR